jgi:hypothetical protein
MGLKPRVEALKFKSKLLPEDLPDTDSISLSEAVAWLIGLPVEQAESNVLSTPDDRCQALFSGRRYKSAGFWMQVLSEVIRDNEHVGRWDWSTIEFIAERKFATHDSQRARNEYRLIQVVEKVAAKTGSSPQQLFDQLLPIRRTETERIWRIRASLLDLVTNLASIVTSDTKAEILRAHSRRNDFPDCLHLSLTTGCIFQRTDSDANPLGSVELWKRRRFQTFPKLLSQQVSFDRSALIECFVSKPDRIQDEWTSEMLARPYWAVSFAAVYLAEGGDLESLYRRLDIGNEFDAVAYSGDEPMALFDDERPASLTTLERLLRTGKISAFGVRENGDRVEPIPISELVFLEFELDHRARIVRLLDRSGRSKVSWVNICFDAESVKKYVQPTLPAERTMQVGAVSARPAQFVVASAWIDNQTDRKTLRYADVFSHLKREGYELTQTAQNRLRQKLGEAYPFLRRGGRPPGKQPGNKTKT